MIYRWRKQFRRLLKNFSHAICPVYKRIILPLDLLKNRINILHGIFIRGFIPCITYGYPLGGHLQIPLQKKEYKASCKINKLRAILGKPAVCHFFQAVVHNTESLYPVDLNEIFFKKPQARLAVKSAKKICRKIKALADSFFKHYPQLNNS